MFLPLLLHLLLFTQGHTEPQSFVIRPEDTEVMEGQRVVLFCQVANRAGSVQWSKDGLLLGYDSLVPGFPRYSVMTEGEVHHLTIENVTSEDDADFQCQVGPSDDHPAIVATAHLKVLLPATSIEIQGHTNGSKVRVQQSESLTLTCDVKGGRPAPEIRWYRNAAQLRPDAAASSVSDSEENRQTITSTLRLHPLPDDNGANYTCQAQPLPTLIERPVVAELRVTIKLDVLSPPGRPMVEGYREGVPKRIGDTVSLKCVSRGGNPLAQLTWLKDGHVVDHSYVTSDWEAVNVLSLVADPSDNGATYTCRATSIDAYAQNEASVTFIVHYAPSKVTIEAPTEVKAGDVISLRCVTDRSNPPSEVSWVVDGRPVRAPNTVEPVDKGGWLTTAEITINITNQERNMKLFSCYAVNQALGETVVDTATVSILYAPDPPSIFGYTEGTPIRAGAPQRLMCVSHGGNPLPTLKWFKGDQEVPAVELSSNGNMVSGEITVLAADHDNGAHYRCETSSDATPEPLTAEITLTVHFPPASVTIKIKPKKPKAGQKVTMFCESGSSNPASTVTWWRAGTELQAGGRGRAPASHGGFVTRSTLSLPVKSDDDGSTFTCRATNQLVQQSVHDATVLSVLYKPVFSSSDPVTLEAREGEPLIANLTTRANPQEVIYLWIRDNETVWESPALNLTAVQRSDAGRYLCQATNDIGYSQIEVILQVFFAAVLVEEADQEDKPIYVVAEPESNPQLQCTAEGYPLPEDIIKWKRSSFSLSERTKTSSVPLVPDRRRSTLVVLNVTREDSGEFSCVADNGVGEAVHRIVILLVKHAPLIVGAEDYSLVRSDREMEVKLRCRAEGVPDVRFTWSLEGGVITESSRAVQEVTRVDSVTWEGTLVLMDVTSKDFGEYKCVARNDVGFDTVKVSLEPDGRPDPPLRVRVVNSSHTSLRLTWIPGFDGGHNQSFRVRFRSPSSPSARYVDVHPPNATSTWVEGLQPDTVYEFALMALNVKGASLYYSNEVKTRTLDHPSIRRPSLKPSLVQPFLDSELTEMLVVAASVVFAFLLGFNIILLACYYRKKKKRQLDEKHSTSDDDEMSDSGSSDLSTPSSRGSEEFTLSDYRKEVASFPSSSAITDSRRSEITSDTDDRSVSSTSREESEDFRWSKKLLTSNHYEAPRPIGAFV